MSTTFSHRHGRAVVSFSDELSWASALDLVGTIDLVVDAYLYSCVDLVVSSSGGACPALDHVLDALARRRAGGVWLRTRIISRASSAAAVLARLGDERVVESGARRRPSARGGIDHLIAIALKALFFESVPDDADRIRGGADLPLVGSVADDFHRFPTGDPVHGEQSFLDTCRLAGACCLLACPSLASIEHVLVHGCGNAVPHAASVSILWNDTASRLVFRSTDPKTAVRVSERCPYQPGLAVPVRVHPSSTPATGECYALLACGRFERRPLEPFDLEGELARAEPSGSTLAPRATACERTMRSAPALAADGARRVHLACRLYGASRLASPYGTRTAFEVLFGVLAGRFHEPRPDAGTDDAASAAH